MLSVHKMLFFRLSELLKPSVDYLMAKAFPSGNFPSSEVSLFYSVLQGSNIYRTVHLILEYLKHHSLIQSALFISKLFFYDNVPTNMSFNERLKAAASALKILYQFCNTFLFTGSFETYFLRLMSIDGFELQGNESDKLVHWCHGAPGVLHMLLLAYKVSKTK
jgi:hypothetical protein